MQVSEPPAAGIAEGGGRAGEAPPPDLARGRAAVWLPACIVVGVTLVGAGLRIAIAHQAFFADEMSTFWIVSTNGLGGVVSTVNTTAEISPPLSFIAAWLAGQFDLSPAVMRSPSLVAGILTIPGVYLLGLRTVGRAAALLAAALTALAPFMAFYSAEARGYALMIAFVLGSTLALIKAVDEPRTRWWVAYAVCSCAAVYTHYTCVFVLGVQLAWLLWTHPEARRAALIANACAVIAFLPWVPGLINDFQSPTTEILSALSPFTADNVWLSLQHWSIGYPYSSVTRLSEVPGAPALILLGLGVSIALAGLIAGRGGQQLGLRAPDRRTLLILALALAAPVGTAIFSAIGGTTIFSTRNIAASWPGLALSFATLIVASGPRLRYAAAGLVIACFAIGAARLLDEPNERPHYGAAADFVNANTRPGDVVIDETAVLSPGPLSHIDPLLRGPRQVIRSRAPRERDHPFTIFDPTVLPPDASRRAVMAAGENRILLVTDVLGSRLERPMGNFRVVERRSYPGILDLVVEVYDPF